MCVSGLIATREGPYSSNQTKSSVTLTPEIAARAGEMKLTEIRSVITSANVLTGTLSFLPAKIRVLLVHRSANSDAY